MRKILEQAFRKVLNFSIARLPKILKSFVLVRQLQLGVRPVVGSPKLKFLVFKLKAI